jgi:hypothetical protein
MDPRFRNFYEKWVMGRVPRGELPEAFMPGTYGSQETIRKREPSVKASIRLAIFTPMVGLLLLMWPPPGDLGFGPRSLFTYLQFGLFVQSARHFQFRRIATHERSALVCLTSFLVCTFLQSQMRLTW